MARAGNILGSPGLPQATATPSSKYLTTIELWTSSRNTYVYMKMTYETDRERERGNMPTQIAKKKKAIIIVITLITKQNH